jgi:hypothetical protein
LKKIFVKHPMEINHTANLILNQIIKRVKNKDMNQIIKYLWINNRLNPIFKLKKIRTLIIFKNIMMNNISRNLIGLRVRKLNNWITLDHRLPIFQEMMLMANKFVWIVIYSPPKKIFLKFTMLYLGKLRQILQGQ